MTEENIMVIFKATLFRNCEGYNGTVYNRECVMMTSE